MPESVWEYPRPPRIEPTSRRIRVVLGGETILDTQRAVRVLETSHPPVFYVPKDDLLDADLIRSSRSSICEFKGRAIYWSIRTGARTAADAAWEYPDPAPGFEALRGRIAVYPERVDACFVDDEQVAAQEGSFYGGWITSDLVGPFKGGPGTVGW
jgi:uncharacterized protein (DUF427 family)